MKTQPLTWTRADWGFLTLFTLVVLFIFRQVLFDPDVVLFGVDVVEQHYLFENYVRESLSAGRLPFWNPYIFSGMPALSHPQYMVFYPGQMLLRWLPLNLAISWTQAIHVWLGGVGMLLLGRKLGLKSWITCTCALVFVLNSGLMLRIHAGHVWLVYALCWFPWVWFFCQVALETGRLRAIVGGAIVISLIILTGHPVVPAYILLFLGLYWAFSAIMIMVRQRSWREVAQLTGRFGLLIGLGVGLSAIQLVASIVMQQEISLASGYNPEIANFLALGPVDLWGFVVPGVYSSPDRQLFFWESVPYMGVLFLLAAPFAFGDRCYRPLALFLSLVALFALLISMGKWTGIYPWLQEYIPGFQILRIPTRALVLWIPAITLLGGMGLQNLGDQRVSRKWLWVLCGSYLLLALGIATLWAGERLNSSAISALVPPEISATLATGLLLLVALILIVVFLFRNLAVYGQVPFSVVPVIVLVCLDPGIFSASHILPAPAPQYLAGERVMLDPNALGVDERILSPRPTNVYMLGRVSHIYGYNSGNLGRYEQFLGVAAGTISANFLVDLDPRKLDFLGVGRVISMREMAGEMVDEHTILVNGEEIIHYLYQRPDAFPRAFVAGEILLVGNLEEAATALSTAEFDYRQMVVVEAATGKIMEADLQDLTGRNGADDAGEVTITRYDPWSGGVEMVVNMHRPGVLVLSEPYYPERKFLVDGEVHPALVADTAFSALWLPAGEHMVALFYDPLSFRAGLFISLMTMTTIGMMVLMKIRKQGGPKFSFS